MTVKDWAGFDSQLARKGQQVANTLGVPVQQVTTLATQLATEVRHHINDLEVALSSVLMPSVDDIFSEVLSFQQGTEKIIQLNNSFANRVQIIAQNYICFIYLKDNILKRIAKVFISNGTAVIFIKFLLGAQVREFRNSISHGDWRYGFDQGFEGIEYGTPSGTKRLSAVEYENMSQIALCFIYILAQEMKDGSLGGKR